VLNKNHILNNRYDLLEKIGQGGMAVVYKAHDIHLDCDVAVKMILTDQILPAALDRTRKRFEREAKDVAKLVHPNIVKVMDYGEEDSVPYLVMPLLTGGTLTQMISSRGRLDWKEAANLLIPIANALEYAHKHNIIHRDVKPSNILFTTNGIPMLADFGVAKVLDEDGTLDLTGTNATVGTPDYMAPEQIVSKSVDHRADIYSLGVVYYEMVTGMRPFSGVTPMETLFKHASEPLTRPTRINPDLPQVVEDFLMKALMKKPDDRFSSMAEMESALRALVSGAPLAWKPAATPMTLGSLETVDVLDDSLNDQYGTVVQTSARESYSSAPSFDRVPPPPPAYSRSTPYSTPSPVLPARKNMLPWILLGVFAVVGVITIILLTSNRGTPYTGGYDQSNGADYTNQVSEPYQQDTSSSSAVMSTPVPAATRSNNSSAVIVVTSTPKNTTSSKTPTPVVCPGMPPSRVKVGDKVEVCTIDHLRLRITPENDGALVRNLNPGDKLEIIGGHVCEDKSTWWEVVFKRDNQADLTGWVKEGTDDKLKYYICPIDKE
jgi:serine/threonine protein kinase